MTRSAVVIGGGVVGLCIAHFIRNAGWDVTLVERGRICGGVSAGNAGEICPALATPLPAPGIVATALRDLYRPDSAFYIHPRAITQYSKFLASFARKANRPDYERGTRILSAFGEKTFSLIEEMQGSMPGLQPVRGPYLYVNSSVAQAKQQMAAFRELFNTSVSPLAGPLNGHQLRELEPCLGDRAQGGYLVEEQAHVDPEQMCAALLASLQRDGVQVVEGSRVTRVVEAAKGVDVHTSKGTFRASSAIVAAGVATPAIAATLGVKLPIWGGKGYSFTVTPEMPPQRVLKLENAHVSVVPMSSGGVRIAGTMEFDSEQDRFNSQRISAIVEAAKPYLRGVNWSQRTHEWMGVRPMTPDGLPIIGAISGSGRVWVAAGHNMLGVMLAPATGAAVAEALDGKTEPERGNPFRPDRFGFRRRLPAAREAIPE